MSTVASIKTVFTGGIKQRRLILTTDDGHSASYDLDNVWSPYSTSQGRTVYVSANSGIGKEGSTQYLIPWKTGAYTNEQGARIYLKDPVADEAARDALAIANEAKGSVFSSVIKSVAKIGKQVVEIDKAVYGVAFHPVTIGNNGLALSHNTTNALGDIGVSDSVIDLAQKITAGAGYAVLGGAAITALPAGFVGSAAGSIETAGSAVIGGAKTALGLVTGAKSLYSTVNGILRPEKVIHPITESYAPGPEFPIGPVIAVALVGLVLLVSIVRR